MQQNKFGKLNPRSSEADCFVGRDMAAYPLLNHYQTLAEKHEHHDKRGVRYTTQEKDIGSYEIMLGGKSHHTFHGLNLPVISRSTFTRHLRANTENTCEGEPSMTMVSYII